MVLLYQAIQSIEYSVRIIHSISIIGNNATDEEIRLKLKQSKNDLVAQSNMIEEGGASQLDIFSALDSASSTITSSCSIISSRIKSAVISPDFLHDIDIEFSDKISEVKHLLKLLDDCKKTINSYLYSITPNAISELNKDSRELKESNGALRRYLESSTRSSIHNSEKIEKQISSFNQSVDSIQNHIKQAQYDFNEQLHSINNESNSLLQTLKTESGTLTADMRSGMREYNISLSKQLENKSESIFVNIESLVGSAISERISQIEEARRIAEADSIAFRSLYEEMREMYQIAGKGELQKYNLEQANSEKNEADRLRKLGGLTMILPVGIALFIFKDLISNFPPTIDFNWVLTRFLTLSILSMPMLYALKESANHRFRENLYRQRGTQLATLGSYLDDYTDEKEKMRVKSELVKNFYSVNTGKADTSHIPDPNTQIKEVVELSKSLSKIFPTHAPASKLPQPPKPVQGSQQENQNVTPINEIADEKDKAKTATSH